MSAGMIMAYKPKLASLCSLPLPEVRTLLLAWEHGHTQWPELPGMLSVLFAEMFKASHHAVDVCPHGS